MINRKNVLLQKPIFLLHEKNIYNLFKCLPIVINHLHVIFRAEKSVYCKNSLNNCKYLNINYINN